MDVGKMGFTRTRKCRNQMHDIGNRNAFGMSKLPSGELRMNDAG